MTDFYPDMADWTREEDEEVNEEEYADLIAEETSKLQRQHDYYECKRVSQTLFQLSHSYPCFQLLGNLLKKTEYAWKHDDNGDRLSDALPVLREALEKMTLDTDREASNSKIDRKQRERRSEKRARIPTPPTQIPTANRRLFL